jgi:hypothetical protein
MRTACSFLAALLLGFTCPASADDATTAGRLRSLGGTVIEADGLVTEIQFRNSSELGEAEFALIGELAGLKKITVYGKAHGLNDATAHHLTKLPLLESLSADGAQLSDAGLRTLAGCRSLRSVSFFHLSFRREGFTGEGFDAWQNLPALEKLTVAGMSMGDAGFTAIAGIKTLQELRVWHTYRTEASNEIIASLPRLTTLKLGQRLPHDGAPVALSDASLKTLATIQSLKTLEIGEARFSLEGLRALKALPALEKLKIEKAQIKEPDIAILQSEMPQVKVEFVPLTEVDRAKLESYLK